jgi:hypothetical protein
MDGEHKWAKEGDKAAGEGSDYGSSEDDQNDQTDMCT